MRRAIMRPPVNPIVLQAVSRANQALANGQPAQAADIFARLAQEGDKRGIAKTAANAHAHAALAYASAKNEAAALTHARAALNAFTQLGMSERAAKFYGNITRGLRENGLSRAADAIEKEFGAGLKAAGGASIAAEAKRGRLPSKCPHCAGPARSDEVDWIDDASAECNFCGGVIQTEE